MQNKDAAAGSDEAGAKQLIIESRASIIPFYAREEFLMRSRLSSMCEKLLNFPIPRKALFEQHCPLQLEPPLIILAHPEMNCARGAIC